jgi:hypothetical protein
MTLVQQPAIDLRSEPKRRTKHRTHARPVDHAVPVTRRRIDHVLVGLGSVVAVAMAVAAALLWWGASFAGTYVHDELSAQKITFPTAEALQKEGRGDLAAFGGQRLENGAQAEAYASYIQGHVDKSSGGKTYAELSAPERAAKAAVTDAKAKGAPEADVAALQAKATELTAQRDTVFKGEVLRGTLLNAYAWSSVGQIAGYAALAAAAGAVAMAALVAAGIIHLRRMSTN